MSCFCWNTNTQTHTSQLKLQRTTLINHGDRESVDRRGSSPAVGKEETEHDSHNCVAAFECHMALNPAGSQPANTVCMEAVKLIRKKKRNHINTHTHTFVFPLSVCSSSPLCCPYRKPLLTSPRLCFCLDLRIEFFSGPRHQIWNRNCSLISLEAGCGGGGWRRANYLPPSLHYAACFPVSASQVSHPFFLHASPSPP